MHRIIRVFLTLPLLLPLLTTGCTGPPGSPDAQALQQDIESYQAQVSELQALVTSLSYNTATGGGINLKMMQDPETGEPTVPLEEVFSFDRNHAFCRVDTNPRAFMLSTYALGDVVIEPHQFYMSMVVSSIDQYEIAAGANGVRTVTMRGGLECATEVGQAETTLGSRTVAEHATFKIEAVDAGIGGGEAGDSFAFTVFFDPDEAPVNHAIFGPEFTFTGAMTAGEISISAVQP